MTPMSERDRDKDPGGLVEVYETIKFLIRGAAHIRNLVFMFAALYMLLRSMLSGPGGFLKVAVTIGLIGFVACVLGAIDMAFKLIRVRSWSEIESGSQGWIAGSSTDLSHPFSRSRNSIQPPEW